MRVALAVVGGLFVIAWLALATMGSGFRRSFGASPVDLVIVAGPPVVAALLVAAMFATQRPWLHAGASVAAVAAVGALWLAFTESPFAGGCALAYLAAWLLWYRGAAWA